MPQQNWQNMINQATTRLNSINLQQAMGGGSTSIGGGGGGFSFDSQLINMGQGGWITTNTGAFEAFRGPEATPKQKRMAMEEMQNIKRSAVAVMERPVAKVKDHVSSLKELGFTSLAKHTEKIAERAMKENLIAARGYTKIPYAAFHKAEDMIRQKSNGLLRLVLTPVKHYLGQNFEAGVRDAEVALPPTEVLGKMAEAKKEGLFDSFEIIHVAKVQDPILVGRVNGSDDLYFIAEWGDDIKLSEILG